MIRLVISIDYKSCLFVKRILKKKQKMYASIENHAF